MLILLTTLFWATGGAALPKTCVSYPSISASEPRGLFFRQDTDNGGGLLQVRDPVPPGQRSGEESGHVCDGLGVFLGFRFTLKLSGFGFLPGVFRGQCCAAMSQGLGCFLELQIFLSLGFFVVFQALPSFSWE